MPVQQEQVHVYWANPHLTPELEQLLDADERDRLDTLRKPEDRARYVTAHALARLVVARHTGMADTLVVFNRTCAFCGGPHGKPLIAHPDGDPAPPAWHVSLSHAANLVLVAITTAGLVGIDVESVEGSAFEGFAEVALSRSETAELARFPQVRRARAQATWWTRKEAVLKATGDGLTVAPKRIVVTAPDQPPALRAWKGEGGPRGPVHLEDLDMGSAYSASVAVIAADRPQVVVHAGHELLPGLADSRHD